MDVRIEESWKKVLQPEFDKDYFRRLADFVHQEYSTHTVFPPGRKIFAAFDATPFDAVKVVILGQDPYHDYNQANGLCFSVNDGVPFPPSLLNIFKEIKSDIGTEIPASGDLSRWARQGVLLLNATLTVRAHCAGSHQGQGWEQFTDAAIRAVDELDRPVVFMLWGRPAGEKAAMLHNSGHLILKAAHPSPLSAQRGFFGCGHFRACNDYLTEHGEEPIDWQIPNI